MKTYSKKKPHLSLLAINVLLSQPHINFTFFAHDVIIEIGFRQNFFKGRYKCNSEL